MINLRIAWDVAKTTVADILKLWSFCLLVLFVILIGGLPVWALIGGAIWWVVRYG